MEDADSCGIIPARYATPTETAIAFKEIVQAANGRFSLFFFSSLFLDDVSYSLSGDPLLLVEQQRCQCHEEMLGI